jgi:two-component system, OmpR family, sensor histidine kinase KdpD
MVPQSIAREAKEMIETREPGSRGVTKPATNSVWALKHITRTTAEHGVLVVNLGKPRDSDADKLNERIDALSLEATATPTRIDATAALAKANVRLESKILRTSLLGTASHELRPPIAAILGTASVLDRMLVLQGEYVRSLVDGMHLEAKRLEGDIQNLLDTARITDTGVKPRLAWTVLTAVIRRRSHRLATHKLSVDVDSKLPLVNVNQVLVAPAIENAVKYSPAGRVKDGQIVFAITDQGIGLTVAEASHLFQRAYSGLRHPGNVPGLGLGLWIAEIFVAANGASFPLTARAPAWEPRCQFAFRLLQALHWNWCR